MTTFRATDLQTGQETTYEAALPDPAHLGEGWRIEEISVATIAPEAPPVVPTMYGGRRRLTKQEFYDLLGDAAVHFLLSAAKTSVEVEAWILRLEILTPEDDKTSVGLDDPRTVAGVTQLGQIMIANGVVPANWIEVVLNG